MGPLLLWSKWRRSSVQTRETHRKKCPNESSRFRICICSEYCIFGEYVHSEAYHNASDHCLSDIHYLRTSLSSSEKNSPAARVCVHDCSFYPANNDDVKVCAQEPNQTTNLCIYLVRGALKIYIPTIRLFGALATALGLQIAVLSLCNI